MSIRDRKLTDSDYKEMDDMRLAKLNYQKVINFEVIEQFFRTFCINKAAEHDFQLRADRKSFKRGIQYWYGGKENKPFSDLIFTYLSFGMENHQITLSEFIGFVREFMHSNMNHQNIIFKMISER